MGHVSRYWLILGTANTAASPQKLRAYVMLVFGKINIYASAGSSRSAVATSALLKNVPLDRVMEHGGWTNKATVLKYYFRP